MSESIEIYEWRTAPAHLRTCRQLAADGLRPNGQDIAGKVARPRRRGREPLTAHLYDVRLAAPKRPATPAQLAALEKATREHQLRAAERHGIDRAELTETDPGPAWTAQTSALEDYRPGSALSDSVARTSEREGYNR